MINGPCADKEWMKFNALLVASMLLALGGLLALSGVRESLGTALDDSWQLALIHAEFALAPLLFLPVVGGRKVAATNLLAGAACFAAGGAVVLLFSFASMRGAGWDTRMLSACVWLAVSGLLALAARRDAVWVTRGRVLLLALFGLPALWHYFLLEYAGADGSHLRPLSPNWALATNDITLWPLAIIGVLCWIGAFALPDRRAA